MNYSRGIAMCGAIFVASAAVAAIAIPANAKPTVVVTAPATEFATRTVTYRDLNLASAADEKVLNRRVGRAVNGVCWEVNGPSPDFYLQTDCRDDAWRGARPQIARAVLRAQQIAATGHSAIPATAISLSFSK